MWRAPLPVLVSPAVAPAHRRSTRAVVYNGNVFVPVASWEETRSLDPNSRCCTFRGSLVALRLRDGQQGWKTCLVPEPKEMGRTKRGLCTSRLVTTTRRRPRL